MSPAPAFHLRRQYDKLPPDRDVTGGIPRGQRPTPRHMQISSAIHGKPRWCQRSMQIRQDRGRRREHDREVWQNFHRLPARSSALFAIGSRLHGVRLRAEIRHKFRSRSRSKAHRFRHQSVQSVTQSLPLSAEPINNFTMVNAGEKICDLFF